MSQTILIDSIELDGTKNGTISIAKIDNPYGEGTNSVASIGVALDGQEVEWKVHIPLSNIDQLIQALEKVK
ncbi:MAG: hypothetical protein IE909_04470 [Campylobacterales bacterium]|nr:hypothetical protein [Campylobacterales bacterium]